MLRMIDSYFSNYDEIVKWRSVKCIEHMKEDDSKKPNGYKKVINWDSNVLMIFLYFYDKSHRMND